MALTKVTNDMLVGPLGSGGGAVNLIENGDADGASASIFVPYLDGTVYPVDGIGGSPAVTTSVTSTNPLTGTKSYLLTKPAGTQQGSGWTVDNIPLDLSYRAKVLKISVDYIVNSGTFVAGSRTTDSDIIWTCYDITNSKIVEPSNIKMFASSTTGSDKFEATVQFDYNCTSFRLMAHVATASSSAYEIKVDNITVSPSVYVYGSPVTDWQSYTPTFVALGTVTGIDVRYRRSGQSVEIEGRFTSGTVTGATATISLPAGLIGSPTNPFICGDYATQGTTTGNAVVYNNAANNLYFGMANWGIAATGTQVATGGFNSFNASVPILGWSSSVQMSDSADTRVVQAKYRFTTSKTSGPTVPLNFDTIVSDTHGAVTTGAAWKFTALTAGKHVVQVAHNASGVSVTTQLFKNGSIVDSVFTSPFSAGNGQLNGSCEVDLVAGDYIDIRFDLSTSSNGGYVNIFKLLGPSAIAASESVNAVYTTAAGQSIPNTTFTIIDFGTAEINSHGNVTTGANWKFTAFIFGVYEISAFITFNLGGSWNTAEDALVEIYKNGAQFSRIGNTASTTTHGTYVPVPCSTRQIRLIAGEYIDLRAYQTSGSSLSLLVGAQYNWVSIKKVGN